MSKKIETALSEHVRIANHYQRSIRLDADYGRMDALDGYLCHGTAHAVLDNMARQLAETNQRAFTWTGPFDGVMLIIDEMGKFLEASATGGDDVYFFQELAEAAARASGRFVVVGILHQSFRQYATRLGLDSRDDWAKVQGRFSDISLVAAN